jgi:hypothetical protein
MRQETLFVKLLTTWRKVTHAKQYCSTDPPAKYCHPDFPPESSPPGTGLRQLQRRVVRGCTCAPHKFPSESTIYLQSTSPPRSLTNAQFPLRLAGHLLVSRPRISVPSSRGGSEGGSTSEDIAFLRADGGEVYRICQRSVLEQFDEFSAPVEIQDDVLALDRSTFGSLHAGNLI